MAELNSSSNARDSCPGKVSDLFVSLVVVVETLIKDH